MLRLRFVLLVSVACLVASQEDDHTETDTSPTSDIPGSTSDTSTPVDVVSGLSLDSTTPNGDGDVSSTEEPSTTESTTDAAGNETTPNPSPSASPSPSPSSATTIGVFSTASLALLAVAMLS